ncbi:MAG: tetratricopeptide repeat protein [Chloroflexi bacterium]|nr:tetratricopeptide repeat protein [Chloroflexota bacterium]
MANLELFLLGPMQVKLDDAFIDVKPRKALALLVYLAVTAERHSRDALATLLWPESSQQTARKYLRNRLSELNLALGADWIEADRESVALRGGYWLDVADFQHVLADKDESTQTLMKAADLYRDDFVIGFTLPDSPAFDEWQFFQAEGLRQSLATALEKLIQKLSEQREYEEAIPYGRRWLALDPLHEPAHRQLMQHYAQLGQQAAALRQYDQCLQTLEKELDISPSQETRALYQNILAGKFEPRKQRPQRRHNLPVQNSTFIGREDEMADIKQLLFEEPGCRLLNLVGPGGVGKTRLALATAVQLLGAFPDDAFFVSLAPVSETEDIVLTMAKALNFTFYGEEDPKTQLLDYLARKEMLLVVDNFEHLMAGAYLLSEILKHAPDVTLLVTSRERLNLQEEWGYDVQGLPFPVAIEADQPEESLLEKYSSLELFLQRARRANARFTPSAGETADIIRICRYVDGTPLGIELAAPWVRAMNCREIADEIERNLDFLTTSLRNIPERHRSLRVVFEQTWERLSLDERTALKQLSIFRGGCTRESAEQVTGATLSVLASLVDKALLHRNNLDRYELHELIRQFAESKLQANPEMAEKTQQNHQDYFVEFLEKRTAGVEGARQKETIGEIKTEMDNVRLAWRRAVANKDVKAIDRSVECLYAFYIYSSSHYEGQAAFQQAVSALTVGLDSNAGTVTLQNLQIQQGQENLVGYLLATQTYMLARLSGSQVVPEEVIARLLREKPGNKRREAVALSALSMGIRYQGRVIESRPYAERGLSLAVETNSAIGQWWSLTGLAIPVSFSHPLKAKKLLVKALEACQKSGDPSAQGFSNQNLGRILVELGEYPQAAQYIDKSLHIFTDLDNLQGLGYYYEDVGRLHVALGDYKRAIQNFHQSIEYLEETRSTLHVNHCQVWLGNAYRLNGDYQKSEETSQAMLAAFNAIEDAYHSGYCLLYLGLLARDQGDMVRAERLLKEALATWEQAELDARLAVAACYLGQLMVALGERRHMEAIDFFQQGLEGAVKHQMAPLALDIFVGVVHLLADAGEMKRAVELLVLAEQQEASTFETKERARHLLAELAAQLPPGEFEAAQALGQQKELWTAHTHELLVEMARWE